METLSSLPTTTVVLPIPRNDRFSSAVSRPAIGHAFLAVGLLWIGTLLADEGPRLGELADASQQAVEPQPALGTFREWVDSSGGQKIVAKLLRFENGNITIEREDGKRFEVPLSRFSEQDRDYVVRQTSPAKADQYRTWTDTTGRFTMEAALADRSSATVVLRKRDGTTSSIPVDRLSEQDRAYLQAFAEHEELPEGTSVSGAEQDADTSQTDSAAHASRTWTDVTGDRRIEAKFLRLEDGSVIVETSDGRTGKLPLDRLSASDREYVASLTTAAPVKTDPNTGEGESHDEPGPALDLADQSRTHPPELPSPSSPVNDSPPPAAAEWEYRPADLMASFTENRFVLFGLSVWGSLALITGGIARLKCRSVVGWFFLGLLLPVVSLAIVLIRRSPLAGECDTHPWLAQDRCELTRAEAMLVDSALFPRLVAKFSELDIARPLLQQAAERLSKPDAWLLCRECADKLGVPLREKRRARAKLRSVSTSHIRTCNIADLLGAKAHWAYPSGKVLHGLPDGLCGLTDRFDDCEWISPNSFVIDDTITDRKTLQQALLSAEQVFLRRATAGVITESKFEERKARAATEEAASLSSGGGWTGGFLTAVAIGALTGNIALGTAVGATTRRAPDPRKAKLAREAQKHHQEGKGLKRAAARLSLRQEILESLPQNPATLVRQVNRWGTMFLAILICLVGVIVVDVSCLLLGPLALLLLIGLPFGVRLAFHHFRVIQNTVDSYPDVHSLPARTFRCTVMYPIACLFLAGFTILLGVVPFVIFCLRYLRVA
jgi:hypothetical protein